MGEMADRIREHIDVVALLMLPLIAVWRFMP